MAGMTNRGKKMLMDSYFRGAALPGHVYLALVTSASAPTVDTNTKSELTEIANGNGYTTGGYELHLDATDFDTLTEDDDNNKAILKIKDIVWTASGGNLPISGNGARYAILTDDNATQGSRQVIAWWDLVSDRSISDTQTLTLVDCELDLTE